MRRKPQAVTEVICSGTTHIHYENIANRKESTYMAQNIPENECVGRGGLSDISMKKMTNQTS